MSLVLQHVSKTYNPRSAHPVRAVRDLDLDVPDGDIIALLGSSGCGKTSTLRMVAGFEDVSEGTITLAGKRIERLAPARRGVAMAFEGYALYPPLNVEENIGFGLAREGGLRRGTDTRKRVHEVADLLEIGPILDRRPAGLSGGQQQRASLARALARDADLHLLDEPMGQLEPQLRAVLRGRVKALIKARGLTAVLVTHDQTEANAMADRIAVMEGGVLQQYGPPGELRDRPVNLFVATFLGEPPMNALPATVQPGGLRLEDGEGVHLDVPPSALPPVGSKVVFGVRPHRITLGQGRLHATVTSNQWLGDQAHVAMELGDRLIVAVAHQRVAAAVGSRLDFDFREADAHVFDAESGRALLHGNQPA